MTADPFDPTFLTKWGRLTSQEYQWRKRQEFMDEWFTPALEEYLQEAWPSPEQIAQNRRRRAAELEQVRQQNLKRQNRARKAQAISDCARTDGYGRTTTQLGIL